MIDVVDGLLVYVESGATSPGLSPGVEAMDQLRVRVIAIKLLGWLRLQATSLTERPLELIDAYTWSQDLRKLITLCSSFSEVFEIQGNSIDFRATVSMEERTRIRQMVVRRYKPRLFTEMRDVQAGVPSP